MTYSHQEVEIVVSPALRDMFQVPLEQKNVTLVLLVNFKKVPTKHLVNNVIKVIINQVQDKLPAKFVLPTNIKIKKDKHIVKIVKIQL